MLKNIQLKYHYNSVEDNIILDFLNPALSVSCTYKRASGYFSSRGLVEYSKGIIELVKKKGSMQLVLSPHLDAEDIEAIKNGYDKREEIVTKKLMTSLVTHYSLEEMNHLDLICNLIAEGFLNIKIAYNLNQMGIYHEKIGIIIDQNCDYIAFQGSMNETYNAFYNNFESFDVYNSWDSPIDIYAKNHLSRFEKYWRNDFSSIEVIDFPKAVAIEMNNKYRNSLSVDESLNRILSKEEQIVNPEENSTESKDVLQVPSSIEIRPYQIEAIANWKENNYKGILEMATGTGKTITALYGLINLWESLEEKKLVSVIVVPQQLLVEQWAEDAEKFGLNVIRAYSKYDWYPEIHRGMLNYELDMLDHICIITTISTYKTDRFQGIIKSCQNMLIIADEAHHLGANQISKILLDNFKYRLACTATPNRYNDLMGTTKLFDYFEKVVYYFSLEEAINQEFLVPYYYYPHYVYLSEDEFIEYTEISKKIHSIVGEKDTWDLEFTLNNKSKGLEKLFAKRNKLLNTTVSKLEKFIEVFAPYSQEHYNLIYCSSCSINDVKQIDITTKLLKDHFDCKVTRYTSRDDDQARDYALDSFKNKTANGMVAIKCLDEGVNIPEIKSAFILSSTSNPKEFIQRRGRVLRKSNKYEKLYAEIHDFVVLPYKTTLDCDLNDSHYFAEQLVTKEMLRVNEYNSVAINAIKNNEKINEIYSEYLIER